MSIQEFLARKGPLVEGINQNGTKIHAVRANDERSWCGRWGLSPVHPQRRWDPNNDTGSRVTLLYCKQCITVWEAANARNDEVEDLLLNIEALYAERDQRAG